jgi:hypothetical protein
MRQAYDYGQTLIIVFQNTKIDSKSTFWMKNVFFKQNLIRKLILNQKIMRQAYDYGQTLIIVFQNTKIDSKSTF